MSDLVDYITLSGDRDAPKIFCDEFETSKKPVFEWIVGPKGERKTHNGYCSPKAADESD